MPDGSVLPVGFKLRAGVIRCRFPGPDGTAVEKSTGEYAEAHLVNRRPWKPGDPVPAAVLQEAAKLVVKAYATADRPDPRKATWDAVKEKLPQDRELRPKSLTVYLSIINVLTKTLPNTRGPADVTLELARRFRTEYAATPFKRSSAEGGKTYKRSAKTVENAIRRLTGLWNKLIRLGYATSNPWLAVSRPTVPKVPVKIPSEDVVGAFMEWVKAKYPEWELPGLFVQVKALIGCRTFDLCSVRSDQLKGQLLTIEASQDKTNKERTAPLPDDLSHKLATIAGPTFLWESYTRGARKYRKGPRNREEFEPRTLYHFIAALFREWNETHPKQRLKPHDLRKRAITLTVAATQSIDQTAEAIGIDPGTARRYYLDAKQAIDGQELLKRMQDVLRPKPTGKNPG